MDYTKKYVQKIEKELKELRESQYEGNYVILRKTDRFDWTEYTAMVGKSPEDAIAKVVEGTHFDGILLAVPSEFWMRQVDFSIPPERIA